jgi:hypothetical protein
VALVLLTALPAFADVTASTPALPTVRAASGRILSAQRARQCAHHQQIHP